jgi:hypothetical protein
MSELNAAQLAAFSVDVYDAADDLLRRLPPGFVRLSEMSNGGLHAVAYLNRATSQLGRSWGGRLNRRRQLSSVTATGDTAFNAALDFASRRRAQASGRISMSDSDVTLTGHGVGGFLLSARWRHARQRLSTGCIGGRCGAGRTVRDARGGLCEPDVNYVAAEDLYTLPRRTAQVGKVVDVQTSSLSFSGQLQGVFGTDSLAGNALESVYDWLAMGDEDRQRPAAVWRSSGSSAGVSIGAGQAIATSAADDVARPTRWSLS